ncbi:MAG: hypothetical protein HY746_02845 [Elusimicrobia bacterium]|nr:hypothetical protein [Elusimicrobiota bacterium]
MFGKDRSLSQVLKLISCIIKSLSSCERTGKADFRGFHRECFKTKKCLLNDPSLSKLSKFASDAEALSAFIEKIISELDLYEITPGQTPFVLLGGIKPCLMEIKKHASDSGRSQRSLHRLRTMPPCSDKQANPAKAKQLLAGLCKELHAAKLGAAGAKSDFIGNLKFSGIYSKFELCLFHLENMIEITLELKNRSPDTHSV